MTHALLEHAMRFPNSTPDDLRRLAMWLTVEEPQLRTVIDEAIETVQDVARAKFWAEAQRGEHEEEAPTGHETATLSREVALGCRSGRGRVS